MLLGVPESMMPFVAEKFVRTNLIERICLICSFVLSTGVCSSASKPQFEVASVKVAQAGDSRMHLLGDLNRNIDSIGDLRLEGRRLNIKGATLQYLIAVAYRMSPRQVLGPSWLSEKRFDVEAMIPPEAAISSGNEMLQELLVERFELLSHVASEEKAGYFLVLGKGGSKLRVYSPKKLDALDPVERSKQGMHKPGAPGSQRTEMNNCSMEKLSELIWQKIQLPVADRTGLKGEYHVVLEIPPPLDANDRDPLARVIEALDKMGLNLKPGKIEQKTIIVDRAEKVPKPN